MTAPAPRRRMVIWMGGRKCRVDGTVMDRVLLGPLSGPLSRFDLCPVCDCPRGITVPWAGTRARHETRLP